MRQISCVRSHRRRYRDTIESRAVILCKPQPRLQDPSEICATVLEPHHRVRASQGASVVARRVVPSGPGRHCLASSREWVARGVTVWTPQQSHPQGAYAHVSLPRPDRRRRAINYSPFATATHGLAQQGVVGLQSTMGRKGCTRNAGCIVNLRLGKIKPGLIMDLTGRGGLRGHAPADEAADWWVQQTHHIASDGQVASMIPEKGKRGLSVKPTYPSAWSASLVWLWSSCELEKQRREVE